MIGSVTISTKEYLELIDCSRNREVDKHFLSRYNAILEKRRVEGSIMFIEILKHALSRAIHNPNDVTFEEAVNYVNSYLKQYLPKGTKQDEVIKLSSVLVEGRTFMIPLINLEIINK